MNNLFAHVPTKVGDGSYTGTIDNVVIGDLPDGGQKITIELTLDADAKKLGANKVHKLNTKKSVEFLKKELARIDVAVEGRHDFKKKAPGLAGTRVLVDATTNDQGFQSYYFKGLENQKDISEEIGW